MVQIWCHHSDQVDAGPGNYRHSAVTRSVESWVYSLRRPVRSRASKGLDEVVQGRAGSLRTHERTPWLRLMITFERHLGCQIKKS